VSGEAALEAAVVLEILTTVLLMPEHLDLEALRYTMWACKWLEVSAQYAPVGSHARGLGGPKPELIVWCCCM
jgi:hypothetical protein